MRRWVGWGGGSSKLTLLSACIWSCYEQFITILLFGTMQSHPFYVCFSSHVGIKQVQFGGSEFLNWSEDLKTEEVGYSVCKI